MSKLKRRARRLGMIGLPLLLAAVVSVIAVPLSTRGPATEFPRVEQLGPNVTAVVGNAGPSASAATNDIQSADAELTVLSLNIAHGRRDAFHQALLGREAIEANLRDIAAVLKRERADVVALQEADGPSLWSGAFDHVGFLAEQASYGYYLRGNHVRGLKTSYGTALLASVPLTSPASYTFLASPPTLSKGFVISTVAWPGKPDRLVDVVSVHLDFASSTVRRSQVEEMVQTLSQRNRPCVVMGDFNCCWSSDDRCLLPLARQLRLTPFEPDRPGLETFPLLQERLDWILVSPELEFAFYQTLSDSLSDHCGIVARLRLAEGQ